MKQWILARIKTQVTLKAIWWENQENRDGNQKKKKTQSKTAM